MEELELLLLETLTSHYNYLDSCLVEEELTSGTPRGRSGSRGQQSQVHRSLMSKKNFLRQELSSQGAIKENQILD